MEKAVDNLMRIFIICVGAVLVPTEFQIYGIALLGFGAGMPPY